MGTKHNWPPEWPGVVCGECMRMNDHDMALVELTDVESIEFKSGVNGYDGIDCVEYPGWSVIGDCRHDALYPVPLTKAAREMLAIAKAGGR